MFIFCSNIHSGFGRNYACYFVRFFFFHHYKDKFLIVFLRKFFLVPTPTAIDEQPYITRSFMGSESLKAWKKEQDGKSIEASSRKKSAKSKSPADKKDAAKSRSRSPKSRSRSPKSPIRDPSPKKVTFLHANLCIKNLLLLNKSIENIKKQLEGKK